MTIIEFYDKNEIENVAGALLCAPEEVVFVGANPRQMKREARHYQSTALHRGLGTKFSFVGVNKNNLQNIYVELDRIVNTYPECTFDLTGGEELYLVAVGMILAKYPHVNCHRFNLRSSSVLDCDANGEVCHVADFAITVEENVNIYGGEIIHDPADELATYDWDWNNEFLSDANTMWEICRRAPARWNAQINTLDKIGEYFKMPDPLEMQFDPDNAEPVLRSRGTNMVIIPALLVELERAGFIHHLSMKNGISFSFKNKQVKRCLTMAGQILEIRIAARLRALTEKDGSPLYNDCKVGVSIDWDSEEAGEDEPFRTVNEIDVLAMKGTIPIFISCKNGEFDAEELYKLNTVAYRFGGSYAKKVLMVSDIDRMGLKGEYLLARANDMGIRVIDRVAELDDTELDRLLRSLWLN